MPGPRAHLGASCLGVAQLSQPPYWRPRGPMQAVLTLGLFRSLLHGLYPATGPHPVSLQAACCFYTKSTLEPSLSPPAPRKLSPFCCVPLLGPTSSFSSAKCRPLVEPKNYSSAFFSWIRSKAEGEDNSGPISTGLYPQAPKP